MRISMVNMLLLMVLTLIPVNLIGLIIWVVIDFITNYIVRLNEIVVASSDFGIINNKKEESEKRIELMFERWAEKINATE